MNEPPIVIAHILLRSAHGDRPGIDVPIAAETVERLTPAREAVAAVAGHFGRAGFTLLGDPGMTIGIAGSQELFEHHFGIELALGADSTYTIVRGTHARRPTDSTNIPIDRLPPAVKEAVSQIALETAVSMDSTRLDP